MKLSFALALGTAALVASPLAAAFQPESEQEAAGTTASEAPTNAEAPAADASAPAAKEEKRICRRVKLDMSSRRATKVCKTSDEWREFNQQR